MREPRKGREQEQRAASEWKPPSVLPDPDPRDGIVHRWIRVSTLGTADPTNVSKRFREGWEPCRAEDYPELMVEGDRDSRYTQAGNIEMGGLVLCRMSAEQASQRDEYYANQTRIQERAVSQNYKRTEDPRMPLIDSRKTTVTFGGPKPTGKAQEE